MSNLWVIADSGSTIIDNGLKKGCGSSCPTSTSITQTTIPAVVNTLLYFVGAIAIIMIIVGGLRYVISAGNPSAIQSAKNTILYSIVGLVLAISAYAIVSFVTGRFGL
jgi:hypothetical protein